MKHLYHNAVIALKSIMYMGRGEPIRLGVHTLRYVPGTRPTRLSYRSSPNAVVRNDALQLGFAIEHVKPGQFAIDIGGHKGQFAVLLGALVGPTGRVISFEPDREAHEILHRNLALNGLASRVRVESLAVFEETTTRDFYSNHANSRSSLAESGLGGGTPVQGAQRQTVRTVSLDDYLKATSLGSPQFVKIDVEGAEIHVLRGARELLRSDVTLVCELHPYAWTELGVTFNELLQIVRDANKEIRYLDPKLSVESGANYGAVVIS
jgi:FkbM family methyltransferase